MGPSFLARMIAVGCLLVGSAAAQTPTAPISAREHLQQGFALRKAGQCVEAIPHFLESFRLVPQPKTLLNLADCEERLGYLADAEEHWMRARDLAISAANAAVEQEAVDRLDELAPRVPHLTIALASRAPSSSRVHFDGVDFPTASLNVPLSCNLGRHSIEVVAEGYEPKVFEVALREKDAVRTEVEPGPQLQPADVRVASTPQPSPRLQDSTPCATPAPRIEAPVRDSRRTDRGIVSYVGLGVGAFGVASLGLGIVEGLLATNDHRNALNACNRACAQSPLAESYQNSAYSAATLSNVGFVASGALVAASIGLLLLPAFNSPHTNSAPAAQANSLFPVLPVAVVGRSLRGVGFEGQW